MSEIEPEIRSEIKPQPHLSVELKHRLGALDINVAFQLTHPWTVLFGPSGSGKSTILRAIAGLLRPDFGKIVLHRITGDQVAADTESDIFVPAHKRAVRWTGQRAALFPHMTVRRNLRFAVTDQRDPVHDKVQAVELALKRFRLNALAEAMPATLSGGEQQRAALARAALSSNGSLLLLDEPFSGLDAPLRDELLESLRGWLADSQTPVLSVTHDIGEAFLLNAEVFRLHEGRVIQQGPVAEVLAAERARLLAQLG